MNHLSASANRITEVTRRNIVDALLLRPDDCYGRLEEVTFLVRVWDLSALRSTNRREANLEADLRRHIAWGDYGDADVLYDKLNILRCSDEDFGRFLGECLHPVVRTDEAEVKDLLAMFNTELGHDSFQLVEAGENVRTTHLPSLNS
jgi:hypothetical protein